MVTCWFPASSCPAPCSQSAVHCGTRVRLWNWACSRLTWLRCRREQRPEALDSGVWSFCPVQCRRPHRPGRPRRSLRPDWSEAWALNTDIITLIIRVWFVSDHLWWVSESNYILGGGRKVRRTFFSVFFTVLHEFTRLVFNANAQITPNLKCLFFSPTHTY